MARKKQYIEAEVIDKAMLLFWQNGYENTSMKMLEKKMDINVFSIYASFGSKHGLFLESLKSYKKKISDIFEKFKNSTNGIESIKEFFYDSVNFCQQTGCQKGCLITNTYYEFSDSKDLLVKNEMNSFMENLKNIFIEKLSINNNKSEDIILKQANFLLLAKHGLAVASKVNNKKEIEDYVEMTFHNL